MRYLLAGYLGWFMGLPFYLYGHTALGVLVGLIAGLSFQLIVWRIERGNWLPWRTLK